MIHADHRLVPQKTDGARCKCNTLQRRTHTGSFGIAYAVDIVNLDTGLLYSLLDQPNDPCSVVQCCVFWQETFAGRGNVCMSKIRENDRRLVRRRMVNHTDSDLVRASFQPYGNHYDCVSVVVRLRNAFKIHKWRGLENVAKTEFVHRAESKAGITEARNVQQSPICFFLLFKFEFLKKVLVNL